VTQTVEVLVLDLLEWLCRRDRSYEETMDAWRTSCPRLPVWEEATEQALVCTKSANGKSYVRVTAAGFDFLNRFRPERALAPTELPQTGR
jgi:D-3-phosphoglycerate dehydrogenase